jgi:hypothetical protein
MMDMMIAHRLRFYGVLINICVKEHINFWIACLTREVIAGSDTMSIILHYIYFFTPMLIVSAIIFHQYLVLAIAMSFFIFMLGSMFIYIVDEIRLNKEYWQSQYYIEMSHYATGQDVLDIETHSLETGIRVSLGEDTIYFINAEDRALWELTCPVTHPR